MKNKTALAFTLYLASMFLSGFVPQAEEEGSPLILWGVCILLPVIIFLALIYAINSNRKKLAEQPSEAQLTEAAQPPAAEAPVEPEIKTRVKEESVETIVESAPLEEIAHDDLEVIEGIGPKISGVLQAAGIRSFAQLASTDVSQLQEILTQAGLSRLSDPSTWGAQAQLAADGKLDELKALQDQLKAGRNRG